MSARLPLSPGLQRNPAFDRWIRIERDGAIHDLTGKVELAQGLRTAIARIAAEESCAALERIVVHTADTAAGPVELPTAGSMSVEQSGSAVRRATAKAKQLLLDAAAERLSLPIETLECRDGRVSACGGAAEVSFTEHQGWRPFEREIKGRVPPGPASEHRIIGRPATGPAAGVVPSSPCLTLPRFIGPGRESGPSSSDPLASPFSGGSSAIPTSFHSRIISAIRVGERSALPSNVSQAATGRATA